MDVNNEEFADPTAAAEEREKLKQARAKATADYEKSYEQRLQKKRIRVCFVASLDCFSSDPTSQVLTSSSTHSIF